MPHKLKNNNNRNIILSHKYCGIQDKVVPKKMGWMWKNCSKSIRKGWKPGAIGKQVQNIIQIFSNKIDYDNAMEETDINKKCEKPTLTVTKKQGVYIITLRPIKYLQDNYFCPNMNSSKAPITSIQFKISKCPIKVITREIKKFIISEGCKPCTCHQPLNKCSCKSAIDKKHVETALKRYFDLSCLPTFIENNVVLSDVTDSDSDLDFDYTPPIGSYKPTSNKIPEFVTKQTQCNENDLKPIEPQPLHKFHRLRRY